MDLSEILDISEEGVAIQTSTPPSLDQNVNLCLDLSETKTRIRATGHVVRLDRSGRAAIRFPEMAEPARRQLKEWLFLNAIMAGVNQSAQCEPEADLEDDTTPSDFTSRLIGLAAVDREVEAKGADLDGALDLIADRALTFTYASGAAIALSQGTEMICVASAGPLAPPLESRLQVGSGFSGECVRTGMLLRCEDSEQDSRVDQESCRALGIRSMMAVPIYSGSSVIGLLEVFSPKANAFSGDAEIVLKHFADTTVRALNRTRLSLPGIAVERSADEDEISEQPSWISSHKPILIGTAAAIMASVLILVAAPWKKPAAVPVQSVVQSQPASSSVNPQATAYRRLPSPSGVADLQSLLALAQQGDPSAEFAIGARYATGQEVKQDYVEAIRWFTLAAEQGHIVSQATLGAYYWAGRGVPPDLEKAYYWSILAQNGGDQASKYRVAVLTSRMTHVQVLAAQQHADDWIKQHRGLSQAALRERQQ